MLRRSLMSLRIVPWSRGRVSGSFDDGLEIDSVGTVDVVDSGFSLTASEL
jgi:hypothetical protein